MEKLRDCCRRLGENPEHLENSSSYLSQLAVCSAIEIDSFLSGMDNDFANTQDFAEILAKRQLKDSDVLFSPNFYIPLWTAIGKDSDKTIAKMPEFALEMRLLRYELSNIMNSSRERIESLRDFIVNLSREYLRDSVDQSYRRLMV